MRVAVPEVHAERLKDPTCGLHLQSQTVFRETGKGYKNNAFTDEKSMRGVLFVDKY